MKALAVAIVLALIAPGLASAAPEAPPAAAPVPAAPVPAAPTKDWRGLRLGAADASAAKAWIAAQKIDCADEPSPRRSTFHYVCRDPKAISPWFVEGGAGKLEELRIVRADDGPVHHISARRVYSIPRDATADYERAVTAASALFGEPTREMHPTAETRWDSAIVRFNTIWTFSDLEVQITLLRVADSSYGVSERWDVPGVEAALPPRPGSAPIHGAAPKPKKNPHQSE